MKKEFFQIAKIIKEQFEKNAFRTVLNELINIYKTKNNKTQLKLLLLKIKIDIENTELNIIDRLGKYYNPSLSNLHIKSLPNNNNKVPITTFTTPNSLNNSLMDKLYLRNINNNSKSSKNFYISNKSTFSSKYKYKDKYKSLNNSNETIIDHLPMNLNNLSGVNNNNFSKNKMANFQKKRSNSHSALNLILVSRKNNNRNKLLGIQHQIDFVIENKKMNFDLDYNKINIKMAKDVIEFIDYMKLLQENIVNKTANIKNIKLQFEKNKKCLYKNAYDVYNFNFKPENFCGRSKSGDRPEIKTNFFNDTIEMVKNNYEKKINEIQDKNGQLNNIIKEKENSEKINKEENCKILNNLRQIYDVLLSLNKVDDNNNKENEKKEKVDKGDYNSEWYMKKILEISKDIKLNKAKESPNKKIPELNKDNINNDINNSSNNKKEKEIIVNKIDNNKSHKDNNTNNEIINNIFNNVLEIISLILPAINGYIDKEGESEIISKLKEDYSQQGIEFILKLLKSYIKQLINIMKEYQRQSNFKDNSITNKETNLNTNTNSSKENVIYMQNVQKKFLIVDRNNDGLFEDENPPANPAINSNTNYNNNKKLAMKTPNQMIKNICRELDAQRGGDQKNKMVQVVSNIQNNLFVKIEMIENEKIELGNKIKELLRINKEIKSNILSNENNIFLKKYNCLNEMYKESQEKIKILEVEFFSLVKELCAFIQNGDKIIVKLDRLFNNKVSNYNCKNMDMDNCLYDMGPSNDSDLLSSIEKGKSDEIFHFLNQNDKLKVRENNAEELINKYKKEIDSLNKIINEMKIRLLTVGNNLNRLIKDKYIYNNYNEMFGAMLKLLNFPEEKIK